jgi:hypothetical protein
MGRRDGFATAPRWHRGFHRRRRPASPHTEVKTPLVRLDLWATWLEIGCAHAAGAAELADQLRSETLGDEPKGNFLTQELQQAIVAVTAFAFAFDGFYDVVRHELQNSGHRGWLLVRIPL